MKPTFSIVVIARNEKDTIPRLVASLADYQSLGGEICVLDTGSTDGTAEIARSLGCKVEEVGKKFIFTINPKQAKDINERFIVDEERDVVKGGDTFFNYSAARNYAAHMATNDIIFCYDADEVNAKMDIEYINRLISEDYTQFEYNFVFAKDHMGNEAVKFVQSKAYDRRVMQWTGIIHEVLQPIGSSQPKRVFLSEDKYKLEHYQNGDTERHSYIKGLALDCFNHQDADRQSHYFARELLWNGRPKSAIKEFRRHIKMNRWHAEKAQSAIFIGDAYGMLNDGDKQVEFYSKGFQYDSSQREPLLKLAGLHLQNGNNQAAVCYAKAALEIPYNGFYASTMSNYTYIPHELLYRGYGWLGNIIGAQENLLKCLEYQPQNPTYLRDTQYYFEYPDNGIEGWMEFAELQFLYNSAKKYKKIVEVGSWKGRSTHALCTGHYKAFGEEGEVICVDTWQGSDDLRDDTHYLAKKEDVLETFKKNISSVKRQPTIWRKASVDAAKDFDDESLDMVFIDAGHDYENVKADIEAWLPKVKKTGMICGHDYVMSWMGVIEAVNEKFGRADDLARSIWWVDLSKRPQVDTFKIEYDAQPHDSADSLAGIIHKYGIEVDDITPKGDDTGTVTYQVTKK